MAPQILSNIKGSEIPASWREKIDADPEQFYTIVIRSQDDDLYDDEDYPEGELTEEIIEAIRRGEEDIKAGRYIECKTKEDLDRLFEKIENDEI
ncbi:MAG: hypothetical protein AB1656_25150 [Candidatus Omnitrophota bacterium]